MSKRKKEDVILKTRTTRKNYFIFYLMVIFLAILMFYLDKKGATISGISLAGFILFLVLVLNLTEIHRMSSVTKITPNYISFTNGILNKNIKKIDYFAISDIYMSQNFLQWVLGYGDVEISLYSKDTATRIRSINDPQKFVDLVDGMMRTARSGQSRS